MTTTMRMTVMIHVGIKLNFKIKYIKYLKCYMRKWYFLYFYFFNTIFVSSHMYQENREARRVPSNRRLNEHGIYWNDSKIRHNYIIFLTNLTNPRNKSLSWNRALVAYNYCYYNYLCISRIEISIQCLLRYPQIIVITFGAVISSLCLILTLMSIELPNSKIRIEHGLSDLIGSFPLSLPLSCFLDRCQLAGWLQQMEIQTSNL